MAKYLTDSTDIEIEEVSGTQNIKLNLKQNSIIDIIYPVGSIYISTSATNPSVLFGGTWQRLQDNFLIGAGNLYNLGDTGGKTELKLSANIGAVNSSPSDIGYNAETYTTYQNSHNADIVVQGSSTGTFSNWNHSVPVTEFSSATRNVGILPPYIAVNIWERIS